MQSSNRSDEYARFLLASMKLDLRLTLGIIEMSKIDQFADDIGDILNSVEEDFGDLGSRARALKTRSKEVAQAWHQHFDRREAELRKAEEAIKRVSNMLPPDAVESQPSESAHLHAVKAGD